MEPLIVRAREVLNENALHEAEATVLVSLLLLHDPRSRALTAELMEKLPKLPLPVQNRTRAALSYTLFSERKFEECLEFTNESLMTGDGSNSPWRDLLVIYVGLCHACLGRYEEALSCFKHKRGDQIGTKTVTESVPNSANLLTVYVLAGDLKQALAEGLLLNRSSTSNRIFASARSTLLMAFGHFALELKEPEIAAIFLGGMLEVRESSRTLPDPLDELGEKSLIDRANADISVDTLKSGLAKGRRMDWEPWFAAMVETSLEEFYEPPGKIPHRSLLA